MDLIARYQNAGFEAVADGVMAFFDRRTDLQRPGVAFGTGGGEEPDKVSTDISLVAIDKTDLDAFALSEVILRGVAAGLDRYLQERPLFRSVCPEQELFVMPIFNVQRYAPGEGFKRWHCDWTISDEATERSAQSCLYRWKARNSGPAKSLIWPNYPRSIAVES